MIIEDDFQDRIKQFAKTQTIITRYRNRTEYDYIKCSLRKVFPSKEFY